MYKDISFIVTYMVVRSADTDKEIISIFYTEALCICSSECGFFIAKNKFVAFTK